MKLKSPSSTPTPESSSERESETTRTSSTLESTLPPAAAAAEPASQQKLEDLVEEVESPQRIRLPTKSKSGKAADSDSDSDSKSTKSSASTSSSKVPRSFKKTFKGKAIAIVKPFSNPAPEKKSPDSKGPVESSNPSEVHLRQIQNVLELYK